MKERKDGPMTQRACNGELTGEQLSTSVSSEGTRNWSWIPQCSVHEQSGWDFCGVLYGENTDKGSVLSEICEARGRRAPNPSVERLIHVSIGGRKTSNEIACTFCRRRLYNSCESE